MSRARERGARRGRTLAGGLIALSTLALSACQREPDATAGHAQSQSAGQGSAIGGSFRLTDTNGRIVTDETLRGKPYAIFFGFTRCPDVCPTTMNRMVQLRGKLGKDADKMNVVFVSVDPEHDKAADIAAFLSMFSAPIIGLTGTEAALKQIEEAFKVYVRHEPLPDGDYTIDHTATIYLMDGQGRFVDPMSAAEPIESNLALLRKLIDS